ncbi:MAG: three-Cys-motif partner protein TcmP [Alphaproteobacteria bacterium]|nr:three-Cys-motif partner protein TcmP [Alphaproteobacteria bacterium]MCK5658767.1 three-Cys-motif partner protein TcmP [Alphaproteobacteria bacterium]
MDDKSSLFEFDKIGYWSELKLEIIEKYGSAYTSAFKNNDLKKYYIDAFSGAGVHKSKTTGEQIEGSPPRALKISPSFDGYYFIDLNKKKTSHLQALCGNRKDVHIHTGDSNEFLLKELLPQIQYKDYKRALCLLDPYGLHLDWEVIKQAGQSKAVDMFLNFPVMDMNRNAIWKNPDKAPVEGVERMNKFWGDESWKQAAYIQEPTLFGSDTVKQGNEDVVAAFMERLKKKAGFKYVAKPLPMKNSTKAIVYYLFFASQNQTGDKIISEIFKKYR